MAIIDEDQDQQETGVPEFAASVLTAAHQRASKPAIRLFWFKMTIWS